MSGGRQPRSHKSWGLGVANTAEWTGTPRADCTAGCKGVLFRGADAAVVEGRSQSIRFDLENVPDAQPLVRPERLHLP